MNTKEKVLQKCRELHKPAAPWINEEWDLKRYFTTKRWELHRHKGTCDIRYQFSDDVPETDPVWPLAAQVLGIGEDEYAKLIQGCKEVIESATALYGHLPIYMLGIDAIVNPQPNEA